MSATTLSKLSRQACESMLNGNILRFWETNMVDARQGGFYGRIDGYNRLHPEANKGIILNTRILWTFAAAYQCTPNKKYRFLADRAYEYLRAHFLDEANGGVRWEVDFRGNSINNKKQTYAQAFAIYALSEYHKINPNKRALQLAIELFELIEKFTFDKVRNGYLEALDDEWKPMDDVRLSAKDVNAEKTMNTHLHILEAYTNLFSVWKSKLLEERLRNLIALLSTNFLTAEGHFILFFDRHWVSQSAEVSYGHDIEGSWLLYEAAEMLDDPTLKKSMASTSLKMVEASLNGLDADGGMMNEGNSELVIDTDKHWWPQAEALVGLVNAWQLTNEDRYLEVALRIWNFIQLNLIDPNGEWHWRVDGHGNVVRSEDKAGFWKCPYHNGRAMLELIRRLPN